MSKNIIDGKQKQQSVFFERLLTAAGWLFVLYSALQIIATMIIWLFNINNTYYTFSNNAQIVYTFFILVILSIVICICILVWGSYNYKKYAKLNRRKFTKDVSDNEILDYFNITQEQLEHMKNDKIIYIDKAYAYSDVNRPPITK